MLPEKFLDRMRELLGEEFPVFLESLSGERYRGLRVNTRKTQVPRFLEECPFELTGIPWAENGFYYGEQKENEKKAQPGRHAFHEAGLYYIQEPSAMAPVPFLEVKPGERVLDLCAAPGGKSTQIADYLQGEGILVSNEIHPARAKVLSENIERMGVVNALVLNETPARLAELLEGYFDKVLVDAPCSGEGMFRKNEEACREWSPEQVSICADRQDEVLDCAARLLHSGGRLVYSTCTFAPEEDEDAVSRFLDRHADFSVVSVECPDGFRHGVPEWAAHPKQELAATLRLMPHLLKGEGHFLAVLQKHCPAAEQQGDLFRCVPRNGMEKGIPAGECTEWLEFQKAYLRELGWEGSYIRFGDQLYLGMPDMPALKGLKVLRPGLHLGTIKKNRFEPSHALALALNPCQVRRCMELGAESPETVQYLKGMTLQAGESLAGEKGWCLVCVDGYSLGWGKLAGGILKNHYPRGLRL